MDSIKEGNISELIPDDKNMNKHNQYGMSLLEKSISELGLGRSIVVDKNNRIIGGNGVVETASSLGMEDVIIVPTDGKKLVVVKREDVDIDSEIGRKLALADNAVANVNLEWDEHNVKEISENWDIDVKDWGVELDFDTNEVNSVEQKDVKKLTDKFIIPPFSIFDTRQGYWQERKKIWKELINDNGESRDNIKSKVNSNASGWDDKTYTGGVVRDSSISILDPVMAEVVNRWFCIENGNTFDCFAGDSVFGYVSDSLGNTFTGIEIRKEQADLNNSRLMGTKSKYINDDGQNVLNHIAEKSQDLLFSCPPYFDLEIYSDLPNDASNQKSYKDFLQILNNAFSDAIKCLKEDRFAVIVVGDVRGKDGGYYRFVDDIKNIFCSNNMILYNDIILVQSVGNGALRAGRYMNSRKVVKMHENILVFYKGNTANIKNNFNVLDFSDIEVDYGSTDV